MAVLTWGADGRASCPGYTAEVRRSTLGPLWLGIVRSPGFYSSAGHRTPEAAREACEASIELYRAAILLARETEGDGDGGADGDHVG